MLLSDLATLVTTTLNSSPGKWTSRDDVRALTTLDWSTYLRRKELQVLVVPEMVQFNVEASNRRKASQPVEKLKIITVMVGKGFEGLPLNDDVAPWEECKEMLDTRERLTEYLLSISASTIAQLLDIEELPVDELELNHRNFVAVTQFSYGMNECGSGPNLLSS